MTSHAFTLDQLGWRAFFSQQLTLEDLESAYPARVAGVHRARLTVLSETGAVDVVLRSGLHEQALTVGDWVLLERAAPRVSRALERSSAIVRMAAGAALRPQAIAANIDTLFVVTSCNQDFNPSRLERYLSLAFDSGVEPVIVLTKADLCANAEEYRARVHECAPLAAVLAVDARSGTTVAALDRWLQPGQTAALAGSSGVGKSTLVNTLAGKALQATRALAEDGRGRHTTTARELIPIAGGAWLIDTPGMRELNIGAAQTGIETTFEDLAALARDCRFNDCRHQGDEGCALAKAVAEGRLDPRRVANYLKLQREAARASRSLRERREAERRLGRRYQAIQAQRRRERGR